MAKKKKDKKNSKENGLRAANKPEYVTGTGQELWRVHLKQDCQHRICDIHNPPQGLPESDWPTHWRADRGLMERICPHGVGHPTTAHMEFLKEMDAVRGTTNSQWEGIHGCDGCCGGNYSGEELEREFELDEEFRPYFDPFDWSSDASKWKPGLGELDWDTFLGALMDRPVQKISPCSIPNSDPEWVDQDASPNGIGPVCKDCHQLIDWHPVDHALGCPWL